MPVKSIRTEPLNHAPEGDERIRTAVCDRSAFLADRSAPDGPGAREGYVYFIQEWLDEDAPIKIGFSGDVGERLRVLRSKTGLDLQLIGWFPATLSVERDLHQRFAASRVNGEWYAPTSELLDAIELVRALHNGAAS